MQYTMIQGWCLKKGKLNSKNQLHKTKLNFLDGIKKIHAIIAIPKIYFLNLKVLDISLFVKLLCPKFFFLQDQYSLILFLMLSFFIFLYNIASRLISFSFLGHPEK